MAAGAQAEFEEFVEGTVLVEELTPQPSSAGGGFAAAARGLSTTPSAGAFQWSVLLGAALMLGAATLLAILPGEATTSGDFWRIGANAGAELLRFGNGLAVFLLFGTVLLVVASCVALVDRGPISMVVLTAQPFLGAGSLAVAVLTWVLYVALLLANLAVLALIIVAYAIAAVFGLFLVFGFLIGMLDQ